MSNIIGQVKAGLKTKSIADGNLDITPPVKTNSIAPEPTKSGGQNMSVVASLVGQVLNVGTAIYGTERQIQFAQKQLKAEKELEEQRLEIAQEQDVLNRLEKRTELRYAQENDIRDTQNASKNEDKNLIMIALGVGMVLVFGIFAMIFALKKK